jgi:hypothetical protein
MYPIYKIVRAAILALTLVFLSGTPVAAQGTAKQEVVVHLTHYTDNLHAEKMVVHLAYMMQTMGAQVTMLLDLEGVRLASIREPQESVWGEGDPFLPRMARTATPDFR